ncbi:MAG: efflux RND transporter periplasmic adaptor subunit [Pseudomonadota bacterium]
MLRRSVLRALAAGLLFACLMMTPLQGSDGGEPSWKAPPPPPGAALTTETDEGGASETATVEATIINAFRSADVGTEVGGVIQSIKFEEGDKIEQGEVVVEIASERYELAVRRLEEKVRGLVNLVNFAKEELKIKQQLLDMDSASRLDVLRAENELEKGEAALAETRIELERARKDLDSCKVRSPFSGYLAVRYKQPHETVPGLEKLFSLVDSERVYAVGHVPVQYLDRYRKGGKAYFVPRSGKSFSGTVERIGKLIDPRTKTKKVYVLIDNSRGGLEVGMTGALQLQRPS